MASGELKAFLSRNGVGEIMFRPFLPPRQWRVGKNREILISEIGQLSLGVNEQVLISGLEGPAYEVVRKAWGFYAAPSLDSRLPSYGLTGLVVANDAGRHYLMIVDNSRYDEFLSYCTRESLEITHDFSNRA